MGGTVKVSVRLLTGLLGMAAAAVLVFGVWPALFSISGLHLLGNMVEVPMPTPQRVPYLTVQADDGFNQRRQASDVTAPANLFPWKDTSNGTRDAATGLPPVELAPWQSMDLTFWVLTRQDRLGFAGPRLVTHALILLVLWLLWRIVRTIPTAEVFTRANAWRMVGIGLAVALGGSAVQLLAYIAHKGIIARSAAAGIVDVGFSFSFLPLLVGTIVLLLAEVFHQGVRLRAEVDGLV